MWCFPSRYKCTHGHCTCYICMSACGCLALWFDDHTTHPDLPPEAPCGTLFVPPSGTRCHGECVACFGVVRATGQIIGVIVPATRELWISEHPVKRVGLSENRGVFMLCWSAATMRGAQQLPLTRPSAAFPVPSASVPSAGTEEAQCCIWDMFCATKKRLSSPQGQQIYLFIFLPSALELVTARRWRVHKCVLEQTSPGSAGREGGSFVCWTPLDMIWGFLVCPSPDLSLGHGGSLWTAAKYVVKSLAVQDFAWNVTKHSERWNSSLLTEFTNFWCWILCICLGVEDFGLDSKGHSYVPKYNFTAIIQNLKIKHVPRCSAGSWPVLQKKRKLKLIGRWDLCP